MVFVISLGLALAVTVAVAGLFVERKDNTLQARLVRYAQPTMTLEEMELQAPITERLILPTLRRFSEMIYRATPGSQISLAKRNLASAGLANKMSVTQFQTRRLMIAIVLGGGFAFTGGILALPPMTSFALALPLAALGYMLPSMWLASRIRSRQEAIQRALADAIDLLTVCVEAGSGFDAALARVCAKWHGPLVEEFERLLADLRMGRARSEALQDLADRTGVVDVQSFVSALIQADILGVGLVKVLRVQADQMRQKRRLRAEEAAQKAPVKMLMPMILLIFPSVYIIILGPAALIMGGVFG
jgi:tight adherence protein C